MIVAFIGTVKKTGLDGAQVEDLRTKQLVDCCLHPDLALDISEGDTAAFTGELINGKLTLRRYALRKFLEPMYEDDLMNKAGEFALVKAINDPFTEVFTRFQEMEEERARLAEQEEPTEDETT